MKKLVFIISLFFLLVFNLKAQTPKEDFLRINKSYEKFQDLSFDIEYTVYANFSSKNAIDHKYGFYKNNNINY